MLAFLGALLLSVCCASLVAAKPLDIPPSNYQGLHACAEGTDVQAPATVEDVPALVAGYRSVKAAGFGGSWSAGFFCPGAPADGSTPLSLVMSETAGAKAVAVTLDEQAQTASFEAGLPMGKLLDFLSAGASREGVSATGWVPPSYPSSADVTFGGLVATGTHSSTTQHGSLSAQVVSLTAVLANGSVASFSEADANPHLFRAMQVSVGRLGVITHLTTRVKPQGLVRAEGGTQGLLDAFVPLVQAAATAYSAAKQAGDSAAQQAALEPLDQLWGEWTVSEDAISVTRYVDAAPGEAGAVEERSAFVNYHVGTDDRFDGYEVAVPLEKAADCLLGMHGMIRDASLADGFEKFVTIRFVNEESAYLAYTQGGPRMFISIDDPITPNSPPGQVNNKVYDVLRYLKDHEYCQGRLHWGKAGWTELGVAVNGTADYGTAWCHFGCAVQQLDPEGKFAGTSGIWSWNATRDDTAVEFASCCTDTGFDAACQCA